MSNTPSAAEIEKLAAEHLKAFSQFPMGGQVWFEGEVEFALAVLAKWAAPQQEAQEPVMIYHGRCTIDCGEHGHHDMEMLRMIPAGSKLYTAPQPAPAPLSEMPYEKRKAIQEGEQISASDAWFHARHNMLDTLDRRNVFRAGFDRGWNAALAAQGGE